MTALAQSRPVEFLRPKVPVRKDQTPKLRRMTLEYWRNWKPIDGWKYDWNQGIITKSKQMVSEKQRFIVRNITRAFAQTTYYQQGNDLVPESEISYDEQRYRIPDLAFFTKQQTLAAAKGLRGSAVPEFVIEIISDNDSGKLMEEKIWEYFENGVKVMWQIFPSRQVVKVYTSPLENKICIADMVCSAAPVLPGFELSVNQIFHLEEA